MNGTVHEYMAELTPESKELLKGMLAKASISHNPSLEECLDIMQQPEHYTKLGMEEKMLMLAMLGEKRHKWAAKLTFEKRCQILALRRKGVSRDLLAKSYGIDRRTVTHIENPKSKHYKEVRAEEMNLGKGVFIEQYIPHDVMDHMFVHRQIQEQAPEKNNKGAGRRAGPHTVKGKYCEMPHRVIIAWKEVGDRMDSSNHIEVAGWYYNDLDGNFPDSWQHIDDKSRITSDACYRAMLDNLVDK